MKKDQEIIKKSNIKLFLSTLLENRPMTRTDIAKKTGISPTSVTRISSLLINNGMVIETDTISKGVGRHAIMLDTVPTSAYTIGVEITPQSIRFAVTNLHNDCVAIKTVLYDFFNHDITELCEFIYHESLIFIAENDIAYEKVIAVGIALSGIVNHSNNMVELSYLLKWKNQSIIPFLQPLFNRPIIIENDTKAWIRGEKALHNIPEGVDSAILVISDGVNTAAINRGKVIRGFKYSAGEIGHMSLEPETGIICDCGKKGCIQTRMARKFLITEAKKHDSGVNSLEDILFAYRDNTPWATELLGKFKSHYMLTLDILESCYNPAVILVSGNVPEALRPIMEKWSEEYHKSLGRCISIIITGDKRNICAVGSSVIAMSAHITDALNDTNIQ